MLNKNDFETRKGYSPQNSSKTQENETITTQNRYEVLIDSDESDTNGCNNSNEKISNYVTASISSRQVNLRNDEIKNINIKARQQKRNEKGRSVTEVLGDSIVKKANSWKSST